MENCIDSIHRVEDFYETSAFKRLTTDDHRKMLKDLHFGVRNLRNAVQHADDRFAKGRVSEGEPLFPAMTSDYIYFAGECIPYAEIAALVTIVWELAYVGVRAVSG